jgi:hypothetical protein
MDAVEGTRADDHLREQVRAVILLAASGRISGVSISNLPDATVLIEEFGDEARRHGVVLAAGSAHAIIARRG